MEVYEVWSSKIVYEVMHEDFHKSDWIFWFSLSIKTKSALVYEALVDLRLFYILLVLITVNIYQFVTYNLGLSWIFKASLKIIQLLFACLYLECS